jgi:tetratricopeptide (TPR) repeat protein
MGFFDKLWKREDNRPTVVERDVFTIRTAAIAELLRKPKEPNFSKEAQGPCETCGGALAAVLLTTGGPLGRPEVFREHPIAVDAWACEKCGVFRYPRPMTPQRMHELNEEGADHGRHGRFAEAELCFLRIVWDWPGYLPGHLNYAEATRDLARDAKHDQELRRRLVARMVDQYEAAIEAFEKEPSEKLARAIGRAYLCVIEEAISARSFDKARRFLEGLGKVEGLPSTDRESARELERYVTERRDRFVDASAVIAPFMKLMGRPDAELTSDARARIAGAIEKLEVYYADVPTSWQAAWTIAKAKEALGDLEGSLGTFRAAHAAHPGEIPIAKDFSLLLLQRDSITEARDVARRIVDGHTDKAELWCNLAVTELLGGDLAAARKALAKSLRLDASDPVAKHLEQRFARFKEGAKLPRTLAELERRPI